MVDLGQCPFNRFIEGDADPKKNAVYLFQFLDGRLGKTVTFQAHSIQTIKPGSIAGGDDIGRYVFGNTGFPADIGIIPNSDKLVNGDQPTDGDMVSDRNVSRKRCIICQNNLAARLAVVRNVAVSHQQILFADFGHAGAEIGSAVDGRKLSYNGSAPDFDKRFFAFELNGLGPGAN